MDDGKNFGVDSTEFDSLVKRAQRISALKNVSVSFIVIVSFMLSSLFYLKLYALVRQNLSIRREKGRS